MPLRRPGPGPCPQNQKPTEVIVLRRRADTPECPVVARSASETESAGSQEAVPTQARSGQKPGVSGMDSDAGMRSLFESERRSDRNRSCPHERREPQGNGTEILRLLSNPALRRSSPGESGFIPSSRRKVVCASPSDPSAGTRTGSKQSLWPAGPLAYGFFLLIE